MPIEIALGEIKKNAGLQFQPSLAEAFVDDVFQQRSKSCSVRSFDLPAAHHPSLATFTVHASHYSPAIIPIYARPIAEHVRASGQFDSDSQILVGYSGGPDSTCLLHLLHEGGFNVVAAHLHHGQRTEADTELKLCQAFCEELGIPFVSGRADVPRLAKEFKVSLEEAGRIARYEFLQLCCR